MNKKRANYLYKLTGSIQKKTQRKNPEYTQYFYQLNISCENQPEIKKIFAFKNKTKVPLWKALEADTYVGKQYLFSCRNYQGSYYLVDWEEVNA